MSPLGPFLVFLCLVGPLRQRCWDLGRGREGEIFDKFALK
jgi:hypothetical protein